METCEIGSDFLFRRHNEQPRMPSRTVQSFGPINRLFQKGQWPTSVRRLIAFLIFYDHPVSLSFLIGLSHDKRALCGVLLRISAIA